MQLTDTKLLVMGLVMIHHRTSNLHSEQSSCHQLTLHLHQAPSHRSKGSKSGILSYPPHRFQSQLLKHLIRSKTIYSP